MPQLDMQRSVQAAKPCVELLASDCISKQSLRRQPSMVFSAMRSTAPAISGIAPCLLGIACAQVVIQTSLSRWHRCAHLALQAQAQVLLPANRGLIHADAQAAVAC